jgi:hypothetical protein
MRIARHAAALSVGFILFAGRAHAGHHQWFISEIYSNASGTVQFVELKGTADNEQFMSGITLNTLGTVSSSATLGPTLPSSSTLGAYLLVGTAGYATLAAQQGAPAPDRVLPDNFLQLDADTVRYSGMASTDRVYTAGQLPSNGIDSLDFEHHSATVNSPQNFAGATGSIDGSAPTSVPAMTRWSIVTVIGCIVASVGLLLRRRSLAT